MQEKILDFKNKIKICKVDLNDLDMYQHLYTIIFPIACDKKQIIRDCNKLDAQLFLIYFEKNTIGIFSYYLTKEYFYIMNIGLLLKYQRNGIGSYILNQIEYDALIKHNKHIINLHLRSNDMKALAFYKKNNYEIIDTIKNFYFTLNFKSAYLLRKKIINNS